MEFGRTPTLGDLGSGPGLPPGRTTIRRCLREVRRPPASARQRLSVLAQFVGRVDGRTSYGRPPVGARLSPRSRAPRKGQMPCLAQPERQQLGA
jgi:hypothetical protein